MNGSLSVIAVMCFGGVADFERSLCEIRGLVFTCNAGRNGGRTDEPTCRTCVRAVVCGVSGPSRPYSLYGIDVASDECSR